MKYLTNPSDFVPRYHAMKSEHTPVPDIKLVEMQAQIDNLIIDVNFLSRENDRISRILDNLLDT